MSLRFETAFLLSELSVIPPEPLRFGTDLTRMSKGGGGCCVIPKKYRTQRVGLGF
jgi:hypothetical protein